MEHNDKIEKFLCVGFDKAINSHVMQTNRIRSSRANPVMVDGIKVRLSDDSTMAMCELAVITCPDYNTIVIKPWIQEQSAISKAIQSANIGLSPTVVDNLVYVKVPSLSQERREELVKEAHKVAENTRIALRHVRKEARTIVKSFDLTKDCINELNDLIQSRIDYRIKFVDEMVTNKERSLLEW